MTKIFFPIFTKLKISLYDSYKGKGIFWHGVFKEFVMTSRSGFFIFHDDMETLKTLFDSENSAR